MVPEDRILASHCVSLVTVELPCLASWLQQGPRQGLLSVLTHSPQHRLSTCMTCAGPTPPHQAVGTQGAQSRRQCLHWAPGGEQNSVPGGENGQWSVNLQAVGRQAGSEAPPGQPTPFPRDLGRWTTPGVGKAQEVLDTLSLHHTRRPISGRAPCGQLLSWTMVSEEWALTRDKFLALLPSHPSDATRVEGQRFFLCSLAPCPSSHLPDEEEHPKAGGPGRPREGGTPPPLG